MDLAVDLACSAVLADLWDRADLWDLAPLTAHPMVHPMAHPMANLHKTQAASTLSALSILSSPIIFGVQPVDLELTDQLAPHQV